MTQSKYWCWTLNNYSEEEEKHLVGIVGTQRVTYVCWGQEIASTGTPHLQGYIEFSSRVRQRTVKRALGTNRVHVEEAHGTPQENRQYCFKIRDGDEPNEVIHEFGEISQGRQQGRRTDMEAIRDLIAEGATDLEIANSHFGQWIRYRAAFQAYRILVTQSPTLPTYSMDTFPTSWQTIHHTWDRKKTLILWGPPGIGKTHFALALLNRSLMISHLDQLKDLDPNHHDGILFDDMDFNYLPLSAQIHLTDTNFSRAIHIRYQTAVIPKDVPRIITTNKENGEVFNLSNEFGVRRRCEIHHLVMGLQNDRS